VFILNDPPYGSERCYNALRLAVALATREGERVRVFLMGDAAACARQGQQVPQGYYNLEHMLHQVTRHGGEVDVCATCMDARGLLDDQLAEGTRRRSLRELADWVLEATRTLVF
jgi:uncharacterized protein involved in oxidation of intracellular sulfur